MKYNPESKSSYIYGETFSKEAPRLSSEAENIVVRYLTSDTGLKLELRDLLKDVYTILGDTETFTINALDVLEHQHIIDSNDRLILINIFIIAEHLKIDLHPLRKAIYTNNFTDQELPGFLNNSKLHPVIISYLLDFAAEAKRHKGA